MLKYIALCGYIVVYLISSYRLLDLPVFSIAVAITFLSLFETPFSDYVFNWSLYSLLVYMLITYHEMDGCILEACDQSESAAFISIVSTIVAWTSIGNKNKKIKIKESTMKVVQATEVQQVPVIKIIPRITPPKSKMQAFPKLHWV